jgi:hypothetical protein
MKLNHYTTNDYENKSGLLPTEKQTQTNPILSASGGLVRRLVRRPVLHSICEGGSAPVRRSDNEDGSEVGSFGEGGTSH